MMRILNFNSGLALLPVAAVVQRGLIREFFGIEGEER